MQSTVAEDITASVTNAEGGVDLVPGRGSYLQRLLALKAPLSASVTQSVNVSRGHALVMVEIRAQRKQKRLHNFAAFLATVRDDQIFEFELWMVEALPAYSDEFWR